MSLPLDTYVLATPSSDFKSKAYSNLFGKDLFFYVSDTSELRVKVAGGIISYTLAQQVAWVGVIAMPDRTHVYYVDASQQMWYIDYVVFGSAFTPVQMPIASVVTFSCCYAPNSNPPVYLLMTDDGVRHNLFVSTVPSFASLLASVQTYNNAINHINYVTRPAIAIHPEDTDRVTVHDQQIKISDSTSQTGFFVVRIPGVS